MKPIQFQELVAGQKVYAAIIKSQEIRSANQRLKIVHRWSVKVLETRRNRQGRPMDVYVERYGFARACAETQEAFDIGREEDATFLHLFKDKATFEAWRLAEEAELHQTVTAVANAIHQNLNP